MRKYKKLLLWIATLMFVGILFSIGGIVFSKLAIDRASEGRVFHDVSLVPERKVALVLGCSKSLSDGRENLYFRFRIDAAYQLYRAKKVKYILVSGDNSRVDYDESTDMRDALVKLGVPAERIVRDFAGFSTLDSVVRAKEVFLEDEFIVVSQGFHAKRAVFIGKRKGMSLLGFAAKDVAGPGGLKTTIREYLARFKTVLDVSILGRSPRFLGEEIVIGSSA